MTLRAATLLPGLAFLGVVAVVAHVLGSWLPLLTPLTVAIAIGAIVANAGLLPVWAERGARIHSLLLETAIVLLGVDLSLSALTVAGPVLVALVLAIVVFGLLLVSALSRMVDLNDRLGSLLAAGSSICGVSAIAAVAPACDADDSQIAQAAATILLFDVVTLLVFPIVGRVLHLDPRIYGVWIGLSMFSTGPVAAAGFAHSATAGEWATITKLVRNALIGVVVVWFSLRYANRRSASDGRSLGRMWTEFPKFLVGFVLLVVVTNAGLLPAPAVTSISHLSDALFLLAFAGLGMELRFDQMRETGGPPIGVVSVYLLAVSAVSYLLVTLLF